MSYLARLLARPEPDAPTRYDFGHTRFGGSAKSDNRGAFVTFGTSPHSHIPTNRLPANDWREGLARLATTAASPALARRWPVIVADALALGERWAAQAMALGWREVDLWGCDPEGSRRLDRDGLAMLLRGRPVLALTGTAATIATPGGGTLSYYRATLAGAVPLWALHAG